MTFRFSRIRDREGVSALGEMGRESLAFPLSPEAGVGALPAIQSPPPASAAGLALGSVLSRMSARAGGWFP